MKKAILDLGSKDLVFSLITNTLMSSVFFTVIYLKPFHLILSIKMVIATCLHIEPLKGSTLAEEVCKTHVPYEN